MNRSPVFLAEVLRTRSVACVFHRACVASLLIVCLLALPTSNEVQGAGTRAYWFESIHISVAVDSSGDFRVSELLTYGFRGDPPFRYAFAVLPLQHTGGIDQITIEEQTAGDTWRYVEQLEVQFSRDTPHTFMVRRDGDVLHVEWAFPATTGISRTFKLGYRVIAGLQVYPENEPPSERVHWRALAPETTESTDVGALTVNVLLPSAVPIDSVLLSGQSGGPAADRSADGRLWTWSLYRVDRGTEFVVDMEFPRVTAAVVPAWQQEQQNRDRWPFYSTTVAAALALLLLPIGATVMYRRYLRQGRDPVTEPVVTAITEPPDTMPAGLVGVLIDEKAHKRDITASLLDLCRRGMLVIQQEGEKSFTIYVRDASVPVFSFERKLLECLYPNGYENGSSAGLRDAGKRIAKSQERIKALMFSDLTKHGYFDRSPMAVRGGWYFAGLVILLVAGVVVWVGRQSVVLSTASTIIGGVLAIAGIATYPIANAMPRRTVKGARARARWIAFARYLRELRDSELDERLRRDQTIFGRSLPFAVAFGMQKNWLDRFVRPDSPAPWWFIVIDDGHGLDAEASWHGAGSPQGLSNQAAQSIQSASTGLTTFLNTADQAFKPASVGWGVGWGGGIGGSIAGAGMRGAG